ncbi:MULTISPECIES: diacylglycerol kinase [unclassified Agarivorans]|uniref:diacylglycerol kinase n=1 Tax=unclassified Agarivorans TaxID=2636026 RepID=UPI003D7E2B1D
MKQTHTGLARIIYATGFSINGFISAWKSEAALRQEVTLLLPLAITALFLPVSKSEQILLIGSLILVLIVELLNSAIETVVDRIGSEWHELSGQAKDIASAAVLTSLIFAAFTWSWILI